MTSKVMTQSINNGQIGQINDRLATQLRDSGLPFEGVQKVLMEPGGAFIDEMVAALRRRVEMISNVIIRKVKVNRNKTATQVIGSTGRTKWYIDDEVLVEMPLEGREEDDVIFFELDYDPTVDELDREYESRGLRPDPAAVAQAMTDDPAFADERPVGVQWRDKHNRACYAIFYRSAHERYVRVNWRGDRWHRLSRFAGVRK